MLLHVIFPFLYWWIFRLFLISCYYYQCSNKTFYIFKRTYLWLVRVHSTNGSAGLWPAISFILLAVYKHSSFLILSLTLDVIDLFNFDKVIGENIALLWIYFSLISSDIEHLFIWLSVLRFCLMLNCLFLFLPMVEGYRGTEFFFLFNWFLV